MKSRKNYVIKLLILAFILTNTSCTSSDNRSQKQTKIELSSSEINLGEIKVDREIKKEFTITNIGDEPLKIYNIRTSCGCTEVEWEHKPIRPHKTTRVCVSYKDKYPGYIHKTITIYGNLAEPIIVSLKGELIK